ncbi:ISAs1 family transposase [uncultured Parasutterella sp.]|nr:ISAs1 family transposase [uncultured Parasutterella sp.]
MKADDSILALIPKGCRVNWNEKQKRFYVFKSSYYYSKEAKRSKEKRVQVGTVVDGVFTYAKSYLMSQELKSLKREAAETKTTVVEKPRKLVDSEITDLRQKGKVQYPLAYVYLAALLCSLSGQTNCVQIADYWKNNRPALESIFEDFPKQDISHDTVRRLLMLIDPDQFQSFYSKLVKPLLHKFTSRVVAVDGQAVRASKNSTQKNGKYILTFYDTDNGIALGQKLIGEKHNEITYAADMVEGLDLRGSIVTADALHTQEKFAAKLIEQGADYCLAVKQNQKTLYYDIQLCFVDRLETRTLEIEKIELGHGRIETRRISVSPGNTLKADHLKKWIGLDEGTIIKVTTEIVDKTTGQISSLDRYFICSLNWFNTHIAEQCARSVRRHWGIENDLHYVLDVDFFQDRTQCKNANYL